MDNPKPTYTDQLANLEEPSIFKEGNKTAFYDELFLEWIYNNEPRWFFHKDAVVCYFKKDGKDFGTRVAYASVDNNIALATKLCIKNVTNFTHCFEVRRSS